MCGICGMTSVDEQALLAMNAALVHRGPDDDGIYVDREHGVGLAARRLSIIDVAGGHQPIANEDGTVWAVFNGEIYNHPALRARLISAGHTLATSCDTEVLVHLYEDFGADLVHALEGMFAFAIWDSRRRTLVLGRDRFGEKPLFYKETGRDLVFASELSALALGAGGRLELDETAIDAYFTFGYVPGPETVACGVLQLPAGHVLIRNEETTELRSYWRPAVHPQRGPASLSQAALELRELLEESMRGRLLADVPVGLFLSGGVDSTLVGALARRLTGDGLLTFSVGYESGTVGETREARTAAAAIGSDHHELILTNAEVADRTPRALASLDQPLADAAFVALHALSEFARTHVKVAVGGEGADELFGGYPRYQWLARASRLAERTGVAAHPAEHVPGRARLHRVATVARGADPFGVHIDWVTAGRSAWRQTLYGPRLRDHARRNGRAVALRARVGDGDTAGALMRLDQLVWLVDDVLVKADRASMLTSLELRTPFLSRELSEFAATIPAATHIGGGGKRLLREVLRAELPDSAHRRRKVAFRVPTGEWLRGPLAPMLSAQLEANPLYEQGWFDRRRVRATAAEHAAGEDRSDVLWPLLALGSWFEAGAHVYA